MTEQKSRTFLPILKSWKMSRLNTSRWKGGRLKRPSVLCMLNYPLKREIILSLLNGIWLLKLNGLALGQEGIECLLARLYFFCVRVSVSIFFFFLFCYTCYLAFSSVDVCMHYVRYLDAVCGISMAGYRFFMSET